MSGSEYVGGRWRSPAEQWLAQPRPEPEIVEPIDCNSLTYLQSLYRDPSLPAGQRMRAAIAALPFKSPKLSATAFIPAGGDFGARLEKAIARSREGVKLIQHRPATTADHPVPVAAPRPPSLVHER